jgi:hypothetical protein
METLPMPRPPLLLVVPMALVAPLLAGAGPARAAAAPPVANAPYLPGFGGPTSGGSPSGKVPSGKTPSGKTPSGKTPSGKVPSGKVPAAAASSMPASTPPGTPASPALTPPIPANPTTASDYMAIAGQAVAQQQGPTALRALGRAETRLISRSVPLFQTHSPSEDPAVRLIEQARQAVRAGDFATAARVIARATPLVAQEEKAPPSHPPVGLPATPAAR